MSDGVTLAVSTTDPTPPYEQLRRQLMDLVTSGVLSPGERLPPVRQLAADLGLAVGTVARTYRELEAAGVVISRRGAGTRISLQTTRRSDAERHQALLEQAQLFVRRARLLGARGDEARTAVEHALEQG
ncbi:MAG: GntR family transcriptional regulator [Mycobacteriaceae bacterium]